MKNRYFKVLGIDSNADLHRIKQAHRKLAKLYHPDRYTSGSKEAIEAAEKMKEISEAYNELKRNHSKSNSFLEKSSGSENSSSRVQKSWKWGSSSVNTQRKVSGEQLFSKSSFGAEFDIFQNMKSAKEIFEAMNNPPKTKTNDELFYEAEKTFQKTFGKKDFDLE